jgi:hypothetical protein
MEPSFSTALAEIQAIEHVVPAKYRTAAAELAALIASSGLAVDGEPLPDLIEAIAPANRALAYAIVASLQRLAVKRRAEIVAWADVLLTFRRDRTLETRPGT